MRVIYCGCPGFGQIPRSFSFNSSHYSPQTIKKSDSNQHCLVTITNLEKPLGQIYHSSVNVAIRKPTNIESGDILVF